MTMGTLIFAHSFDRQALIVVTWAIPYGLGHAANTCAAL